VQISSGLISGHTASNATGVSEYFGIPFAAPPIGTLRFRPPVQLQSSSSAVDGNDFVQFPIPSRTFCYAQGTC
jgi:cholinesterase